MSGQKREFLIKTLTVVHKILSETVYRIHLPLYVFLMTTIHVATIFRRSNCSNQLWSSGLFLTVLLSHGGCPCEEEATLDLKVFEERTAQFNNKSFI